MIDHTIIGGRYRLSAGLAQGSMAEVYRGVDLELGRPVAVKRLKRELADDAGARRAFEREARLTGRLSHPGVVQIFDAGETEPTRTAPVLPYLVLELLPGQTLQSLVARGEPVGPSRALGIIESLLGALAHCHAAGVLHRDIKPANVALTDTGGVKLMDFGIACLVSDGSATRDPEVRGTVKYMAPERLRGAVGDPRSDLYSVGALLYQLLVGRPPFVGDASAVMLQQLQTAPVRPGRVDPSLGGAFDELLLTALAKDPADRHPTATRMQAAVAELLAGELGAPAARPDPSAGALVLVPPVVGPGPRRRRRVGAALAPGSRRRTVLAAGLAAALLPAAGLMVSSSDVDGGHLTAGANAVALRAGDPVTPHAVPRGSVPLDEDDDRSADERRDGAPAAAGPRVRAAADQKAPAPLRVGAQPGTDVAAVPAAAGGPSAAGAPRPPAGTDAAARGSAGGTAAQPPQVPAGAGSRPSAPAPRHSAAPKPSQQAVGASTEAVRESPSAAEQPGSPASSGRPAAQPPRPPQDEPDQGGNPDGPSSDRRDNSDRPSSDRRDDRRDQPSSERRDDRRGQPGSERRDDRRDKPKSDRSDDSDRPSSDRRDKPKSERRGNPDKPRSDKSR